MQTTTDARAIMTFRIEATADDGTTTFRSGLTAGQAVTMAETLENAGERVRLFAGDRRISALTVCRLALGESIDWWLRASA